MRILSLVEWLLLAIPLTFALSTSVFRKRVIGVATPGALGVVRVIVFGVLAYCTANVPMWRITRAVEADRQSLGITHLLDFIPGFSSIPAHAMALLAFKSFAILFSVLACVGLFTRFTVPLATLFYLILAGWIRGVSTFNHSGIVPLYCAAVLCLTHCGDGLSLDRLLRKRRGKPVPPGDVPAEHYAWGRYLVWLAIVLPYMSAGLCKLSTGGWDWWYADNLRFHALRNAFSITGGRAPTVAHLASWPDFFWAGMGLLTLFAELGSVFLLFSRWARLILPFLLAGMHVGIMKLMAIPFVDLILLQLVFLPYGFVSRRVATDALLGAPACDAAASSARFRFPAMVAAIMIALQFGVWKTQFEYYPLTAFAMYSENPGVTTITRWKVYARDASTGKKHSFNITKFSPKLTQIRRWLRDAFDRRDPKPDILIDRLQHFGRLYNRSAEPSKRITEIEIVQYWWNFVKAPDDPKFGEESGRLVIPVPPN